ncbi:MAG: AAA family ATPase [Myxococcota bacterium]|nr:AAA family ATPase [Myxococcota bacterium]
MRGWYPSRSSACARFDRRGGLRASTMIDDALQRLEGQPGHHGFTDTDVRIAQELARLDTSANETDYLSSVMLALTMIAARRGGSTRVDIMSTGGRACLSDLWHRWLTTDESPSIETGVDPTDLLIMLTRRIEQDTHGLVGSSLAANRPFVCVGHHLYMHSAFIEETALAQILKNLSGRQVSRNIEHTKGVSQSRQRLTDEQNKAVESARHYRLSCVSGGPGTGKTSITVEIVQSWLAEGMDPAEIRLAAPTGKAAWRMGESLARGLVDHGQSGHGTVPKPTTIHRLLDYRPATGTFGYHHNAPIPARGLIIDEASMIETSLAKRILEAARPDARIVFLGDQNQLPSVGAGSFFATTLNILDAGVVHLTQNFRMRSDDPDGHQILTIAQATCQGRHWPATQLTKITDPVEAQWGLGGVDHLKLPETQIESFLREWYARHIAPSDHQKRVLEHCWAVRSTGEIAPDDELTALFDQYESQQLMAVTRAGRAGVRRLNRVLHGVHGARMGVSSHEPYIVGEPFIIVRNDDRNGVYNGDVGLILRVDFGAGPQCAFTLRAASGIRALPLATVARTMNHAYGITVHKAQGSEYQRIGLILPSSPTPFLTRELLYTALTRARRSVTVVGQDPVIEAALQQTVVRNTGLRDRFDELSS